MPRQLHTEYRGMVWNTSGGSIVKASPSTPISTGPAESTMNRGVAHSSQPGNRRI